VVRELVNLSHSAYIHSLLFVCAFPAATLLLFLLVQATQILGRDAKRSTAHLGIPERCSDRPILTLPIRLRALPSFSTTNLWSFIISFYYIFSDSFCFGLDPRTRPTHNLLPKYYKYLQAKECDDPEKHTRWIQYLPDWTPQSLWSRLVILQRPREAIRGYTISMCSTT
jgi:hypothetical protein